MLSRLPLIGLTAVVAIAAYGTLGCGLEQTDLRVQVLDAASGNPVVGAQVEVDYLQERTNVGGMARFLVRPGAHDLSIAHRAYEPLDTSVVLYNPGMAVKTVSLQPLPPTPPTTEPSPGASPQPGPSATPAPGKTITVFGRVTDPAGTRIPKASVYIESEWGIPFGTADTSAVGEYKIAKLPRNQALRITAIADGYRARTRVITPSADWRLDFTGVYALAKTPPVTQPDAGMARVTGKVEDTQGRALDGVIVKAEAYNTRHPFKETAIARKGHYEIVVPTGLPLRFIASKYGHRSVTFVETIAPRNGEPIKLHFQGQRALDPTPIFEGKSEGDETAE